MQTIKTGYFPPLDSPGFKDRIARKGVLSTCRGGLLLLMPLFGIYLVSLGHQVYGDLMKGRSVAQVAQVVADECRS